VQKTNQFNLTTRRHSAAQLTAMTADPSCGAFTLRLVDRFGDSGIVATAIVRLRDDAATVDTLLMSCRVIGRMVETALLAFVVDWARGRGAAAIEGEFIPTAKNAPAADFYARHGFVEISQHGNGHGSGDRTASRWRLATESAPFQWPRCIQLHCERKVKV
jgi:FkbH-like protein